MNHRSLEQRRGRPVRGVYTARPGRRLLLRTCTGRLIIARGPCVVAPL